MNTDLVLRAENGSPALHGFVYVSRNNTNSVILNTTKLNHANGWNVRLSNEEAMRVAVALVEGMDREEKVEMMRLVAQKIAEEDMVHV